MNSSVGIFKQIAHRKVKSGALCRVMQDYKPKILKSELLSPFIESTLLLSGTTAEQVDRLCEDAKAFKFRGVCVLPYFVSQCAKSLAGSGLKIISVIGFPLGGNTPKTKVFEARDCVSEGASEIDMVMNLPAFKSQNFSAVEKEITAVVQAVAPISVKVIIETSLLNYDEKIKACEICISTGARFVKTSTGFGSGGATVEDIQLIRSIVGNRLQIKASGGIRSSQDALKLIAAGANTLGTSRGIEIVQNKNFEQGGY